MICHNCGKKIPDGSSFCNHCGAPTGGPDSQNSPENDRYYYDDYEGNRQGYNPSYDANDNPNYDPDYDPGFDSDPRLSSDPGMYDQPYDDYPDDRNAPAYDDRRHGNNGNKPKKSKVWLWIVLGVLVAAILIALTVLAVSGKIFGEKDDASPTTANATVATAAPETQGEESKTQDDDPYVPPAANYYAGDNGGGSASSSSQSGSPSSASEIPSKPETQIISEPDPTPSSDPVSDPSCLESEEVYKPVIYLYPEKKTDVSVKLDLNGTFSCTDPPYNNGWKVTASPNGTLKSRGGSTYPYLFWEGKLNTTYDFSTGYCVKGSETEAFLKDQLTRLGLNEAERKDFLEFWLPYMKKNPYNVIAFQTSAYTDAAKLRISPQPDSVIRVFMAWYPSDDVIQIPAQQLSVPQRNGFTAVEWGGTKVH